VMWGVGRDEEALVLKRRSHARDPGSPVKLADVAIALARLGQLRATLDFLDRAQQEQGPSARLVDARYQVPLRCGQPGAAARLLEPEVAHSQFFEPAVSARMLQQARAMLDPTGPDAASILRALPGDLADSPSNATLRLVTLSRLGRKGRGGGRGPSLYARPCCPVRRRHELACRQPEVPRHREAPGRLALLDQDRSLAGRLP
jgi:hypothetical protein